MLDYFEQYLMETAEMYSGRCVLEGCDNYNPYSGITNKSTEAVNSKHKRLNR